MSNIVAFRGGQKGDTLANWLNGFTTLGPGYTADTNNQLVFLKNDIAKIRRKSMWFTLSDEDRSCIALQEEQALLTLVPPEKFLPYHLNYQSWVYFQNKEKFKIFNIWVEDEYVIEAAFQFVVKRPKILSNIVASSLREKYELGFQTQIATYDRRRREFMPNEIKVSYKKVFKEQDPDYFVQTFGRPIDDDFVRMNAQTTVPEIVSTPAGMLQFKDNKIHWIDKKMITAGETHVIR